MSEFEPYIKQNQQLLTKVAELEREVKSKQAKIDALMLEYCPEEMTSEQLAEWGKHQVPVKEQL